MSLRHCTWVLLIATAMVASFAAFAAPASAHDDDDRTTTYRVTAENLTENQTLTPAVVTAHERSFMLFQHTRQVSNGLQQLAENGGVPVPVDELTGNDEIGAVVVAGSVPIAPGQSISTLITTTGEYSRISVATMLICASDGFAAVAGAKVSDRRAETTRYATAYDAGTETNTELFGDLVPPCDGDPNTGTGVSNPALADNGTVQRHPGIQGIGDLASAHDWSGPVLEITIERIG